MELCLEPWTLATDQKPGLSEAIAAALPGNLLPVLLGLAGFTLASSEEALRLHGQLTVDDIWQLDLVLRQPGTELELRQNRILGSSVGGILRGAFDGLLALLSEAEAIPLDFAGTATRELAQSLEFLTIEELGELCRLLQGSMTSKEPEGGGLPAIVHQALLGLPPEPPSEELALGTLWLGLAGAQFALAERSYVVLSQLPGPSARLKSRIALTLAEARFERGHLAGFHSLTAKALAQDPSDRLARRQQATSLLLLGEGREALEIWRSLKAEYPDDAGFLVGEGRALIALGQHDAAAGVLLQALVKLDGQSGELEPLLCDLCAALIQGGRFKEVAILAVERDAAFAASNELTASLAAALMGLGDCGAAVERLADRLGVAPEFVAGHALRSQALRALGEDEKAIESARAAVEAEPETRLWKIALADALVEAGRHDEAASVFAKLATTGPITSGAWSVLMARKKEEEGSTTDAERWLREALAELPDDAFVRSQYGAFLISQGRSGEAVDLCATFLETRPRYPEGLLHLQTALLSLVKDEQVRLGADFQRLQALLVRTNERLAALDDEA